MENILDNFIVFEGLDGCGKSTQLRLLAKRLSECGRSVATTYEPTGNEIGSLVRRVLRREVSATAEALALLYSADRHDHLYNSGHGIYRMAEGGTIVLSDRYFYSSMAYQTVDLDWDFISSINQYPHPRIVIYLDASVELCMERIDTRGEERELFEREEYLSRVKENFERAFSELPQGVNLVRIPAELPVERASELVHESVKRILSL